MKNFFILLLLCSGASFAKGTAEPQVVNLSVTEKGFEPSEVNVKPGTHVLLKVTRKTDSTCATEIKITEKKIKKDLPLNKEVSIDIGTLTKGEIHFACGMDMVSGHITVK